METVATEETVVMEENGPAGDTIASQPISQEFSDLLCQDDDRPGPPFFDATLNFLDSQFMKVNADAGKLRTKKFKIEDEIALKEDERTTIQALLIEEFRERQPRNPETGELLDPPFAERVHEDADEGDEDAETPDDTEDDDTSDDHWSEEGF